MYRYSTFYILANRIISNVGNVSPKIMATFLFAVVAKMLYSGEGYRVRVK
jgi:hypothetical protein